MAESGRGASPWRWPAGLAAAAAVGFAAAWSLRPSTPEAAEGDVAGRTEVSATAPALAGRPAASPGPGPGAGHVASSANVGASVSEEGVETASGREVARFDAHVAVRVVTADGEPVQGARVYAVPVGATWDSDGTPPWPQTDSGSDGRALLTLARGGRFDVGARAGLAHALVEDVEARAGGQVEVAVRLPETAELRVAVEGVEESRLAGAAVRVRHVDGARAPARDLPARGERLAISILVPWEPPEVTVRLPRGEPVLVDMGGQNLLLEPPTPVATAPGRVVLVEAERRPLVVRVHLRASPGAGALPVDAAFTLDTGVRGPMGSAPLHLDDARVAAGAPTPPSIVLDVPPWAGRLSWEGSGVVASAVDVPPATRGNGRTIDIDVLAAPGDAPRGFAGVDVEGAPPSPAEQEPTIWTWRQSGVHVLDLTGAPLDQPTPVPAGDGGRQALVTWGPWWASEVVTLPKEGRARIEVRPAGWLMAVMDRPPPASAGRLTVTRGDDGWVGVTSGEDLADDSAPPMDVPLMPGSLLGPFPEGSVRLVVRAGGLEIARLEGHVRAGRIGTIRFPW